jgi:hypothetical protein
MQHALSTTFPEDYLTLSEECRLRAAHAIDPFVAATNTQLADLYQSLAEHLIGSLAVWIRLIAVDPRLLANSPQLEPNETAVFKRTNSLSNP